LEGLVSSVLSALSVGMIIPVFGLFIVAHETANLFPTPIKAKFENRSCAMFGGKHFGSQTSLAEYKNSRESLTRYDLRGSIQPEMTNHIVRIASAS
jgi:hypothetical protein